MIIIFFNKYMLYKNAHDRTILIFLNVIIFLKIGCTNINYASISTLFPYIFILRFYSEFIFAFIVSYSLHTGLY